MLIDKDDKKGDRPLIYAHRGFSGRYPENTMPAFGAAAQLPLCDGIENDVQLTLDGEVVICHDERIDRTCTSGHKGYIKDYTLAELKQMDFSYGHLELAGKYIMPTLEEYLELVSKTNLISNIELKTGVFTYPGIEQKVYDLICAYGVKDRVIISSFNHYSILRMKSICPELPCGLLTETWLLNAGGYVKEAGCEYYHPEFHSMTPELADGILTQDVGINTWTVNTREDICAMINRRVTGIITNYPDLAAACLQ